MSTDPKVNTTAPKSGRDQANLQLNSLQLIAANESEILYPSADTPAGRGEGGRTPNNNYQDFTQAEPGGLSQM